MNWTTLTLCLSLRATCEKHWNNRDRSDTPKISPSTDPLVVLNVNAIIFCLFCKSASFHTVTFHSDHICQAKTAT